MGAVALGLPEPHIGISTQRRPRPNPTVSSHDQDCDHTWPTGRQSAAESRRRAAYTPDKTGVGEDGSSGNPFWLGLCSDGRSCYHDHRHSGLPPAKRASDITGEVWQSGARIWRPCRPDLDNVIKAALDAAQLAGVLKDDGLVVELHAVKVWAAIGEAPQVILSFSEVE